MKTHKDLDGWKGSMILVNRVYEITKNFPKEELYGLTNQIRRSAVSVPSNIAEGAARQHVREFIQYLHVASGSLAELETQLIISNQLGYITHTEIKELSDKMNEIRAQIHGLIKYLKNK